MKKRPLIVVEWEDIATYHSWRSEDETDKVSTMICHTAGWRVKAPSPKKLAVAATRNCVGDCCSITVIPKVNVKSIRRLE